MPIQQGMSSQSPAIQQKIANIVGLRSRRSPRRSNGKRRAKSNGKRRVSASSNGRKLKFGSPAWQKKYRVGKYRRKK
jgi:hypothetical protein